MEVPKKSPSSFRGRTFQAFLAVNFCRFFLKGKFLLKKEKEKEIVLQGKALLPLYMRGLNLLVDGNVK